MRGIAVQGDRLVVANAERLFFFDLEWNLGAEFTHPWFGGIHDLYADPEGIWVCCTNADLLARMTWNGEVVADWEWRRDRALRTTLGLGRVPPVDRELDYRVPETMRFGVRNLVHLNAVAPAPDGGLLVSLGRILSPGRYRQARAAGWLGAVASRLGVPARRADRPHAGGQPVGEIAGSSSAILHLRPGGQVELLAREKDVAVPNHNVWLEGQTLLYNDSNRGHLVAVDLSGRRKERRIRVPGGSRFVRGLTRLSATSFLVGGYRPAAVYRVDLERGAVTQTLPISDDPAESVYAIQALPTHGTG